ncbi:MAG: transposase [Terriglobia bacterium]
MARPLRIQYEGGLYHVTLRGNERKAIVRDDEDRHRFLQAVGLSVLRHGVRLHLYCLMDNHAHLVVETPHGNLSAFMQNFQTRYVVGFNRRHRRWGHLMQGRYGARLVEGDRYLLQLSRYLHLNPVRTRTAEHMPLRERLGLLRGYGWSSYLSYIGAVGRPEFLTEDAILEQVGGRGRQQRDRYREYVEEGLVERDEELEGLLSRESGSVGSERFQAEMEQKRQERVRESRKPEDAAFRRPGRWVTIEQVQEAVARVLGQEVSEFQRQRKLGWERALLAKTLVEQAGLTQREAARLMGLKTGAAVCIQLRRLHKALPQNAHLKGQVREIASQLNLIFKG